jgi:hypothetical protein
VVKVPPSQPSECPGHGRSVFDVALTLLRPLRAALAGAPIGCRSESTTKEDES